MSFDSWFFISVLLRSLDILLGYGVYVLRMHCVHIFSWLKFWILIASSCEFLPRLGFVLWNFQLLASVLCSLVDIFSGLVIGFWLGLLPCSLGRFIICWLGCLGLSSWADFFLFAGQVFSLIWASAGQFHLFLCWTFFDRPLWLFLWVRNRPVLLFLGSGPLNHSLLVQLRMFRILPILHRFLLLKIVRLVCLHLV